MSSGADEVDRDSSNDTKSCPACGESIKAAAVKCRYCGEDIEAFVQKREAAVEKVLYEGRPAALYSVGRWVLAVVTLGLAGLYFWLESLSTRFEITTQRVRIERGLLSKSRQDTELFRVDDFVVEQPFEMRVLGHSLLYLRSSDRSTPEVRLYGIPNLDELAEQLRQCSQRERERRGIKTWAQA